MAHEAYIELMELRDEIARLRAVPDAVNRFTPDSDEPNVMQEHDNGDYLNYSEVVAAMRKK